ncbi:glucokinase [Arcanobacterium wilhelmae]|uniref:Glucokinase n=1 Tax=Arcanobacterium wilhelmae TaxID=1803177 RepID=A0ABT9NAQ1_9ACTO|nr:ROK family protein [Arcanobacterium wilhelmae]MDP9800770.1 glucokinase [Arcanobacterium wilhelmae]WFN90151.1 ROK family protein [Arcanobacterium wilhelmae]
MASEIDGRVLALDIGGTKVGWAVLGCEDRVLDPRENTGASSGIKMFARGVMPTDAPKGGEDLARRVAELAAAQVEEHGCVGVAVASAGVVDPETGAIISATDTLPGWSGTPLGEILREATGQPVWIINDVHAHGLGEARLGAGRGSDVVLSIAVGTGIGGALIRSGEIDFGAHSLAGHFGHVHHHFGTGIPCSCGRAGHLEAFASGSGLATWYNHRSDEAHVANGAELRALADAGDHLALACFSESAYAVGEVLGSLANCVDPHVIVISGSVANKNGEDWWDNVRAGYAASAMDGVACVPLVGGELGDDAPLLGAYQNFMARTSVDTTEALS